MDRKQSKVAGREPAPTTILPRPYSNRRSVTAGMNPLNDAVREDNLHAPTRGGVPNLARAGTAHPHSDTSTPRRPSRSNNMLNFSSPRPRPSDNASPHGKTSKFWRDGSSASTNLKRRRRSSPTHRDNVDGDPLNITSEPINVSDSDEDEVLPKDHLPGSSATGSTSRASTMLQRHKSIVAEHPTSPTSNRQISDSASHVPTVDLSKMRRPGAASRMKSKVPPKELVGTAAASFIVQPKDTRPFISYKKVWWGSRSFTADAPNEPTIITLNLTAPAISLYTYHDFVTPCARPTYKIPYSAVRRVQYLASDQEPVALILSIALGSDPITGKTPEDRDRLKHPYFDPPGSSQNTFLSTIFFEIDVGGAWWRSHPQGRLLSSRDMYGRIADSMCRAGGTEKEAIREMSARSLLEAHEQEAQHWNENLGKASRHGENSERRFEDLYPSSVPPKSRKRSRSPTQIYPERRTPRVRVQRRLTFPPTQTREAKDEQELPEPSAISNPHELMLVYPPNGAGSVNITRGDFKRLDPGEYFNDTLIEFGLKYAINQIKDTNPTLVEDVHIFNSFFYKKLSSKSQLEGYQSVRKWTSKTDIFAKRYIFIPINENFHWYLAIIFMPKLVLPPNGIPASIPPDTRSSARLATKGTPSRARHSLKNPESDTTIGPDTGPAPETEVEAEGSASELASPSPASESQSVDEMVTSTSQFTLGQSDAGATEPVVHIIDDSASEEHISSAVFDEQPRFFPSDKHIDMDQNAVAANSSGGNKAAYKTADRRPERQARSGSPTIRSNAKGMSPQSGAAAKKNMVEKPEVPKARIFLLDSLGVEHPQPRRILAQYLLQEAHDKKQIPEGSINDPSMKQWFKEHTAGHNVKVPVQPNHCDCGVYLIHFAETFLSNPSLANVMPNARLPATEKNAMWRKKDVESKRDLMRDRIQKLAEEWEMIQSTSKSKDHAATSPDPVAIGPAETPTGIQVDNPTEPALHALAPSSPARQQSSEAGEVEAMLGSASDGEALGTIRRPPLHDHNYATRRPSDHGMDLDLPEYQPDLTASSIMFPLDTPPRTILLLSPPFVQPVENVYSYNVGQTPPTGSNHEPSHVTQAELEYPQSMPPTRTPRPNSRTIAQNDNEESPSPPHSLVGDQLRAHRPPVRHVGSMSSLEMQTLDMPPEPRVDGSLAPNRLAKGKEKTRNGWLSDDIEDEEGSDSSSDFVMIVDSEDRVAAPRSKPGTAVTRSLGRIPDAPRSLDGPSLHEFFLPKSRNLRGVSHDIHGLTNLLPFDPISEVHADVIRAEDVSPVSSGTSHVVTKVDKKTKMSPAARIR